MTAGLCLVGTVCMTTRLCIVGIVCVTARLCLVGVVWVTANSIFGRLLFQDAAYPVLVEPVRSCMSTRSSNGVDIVEP